MQVKASLAPTHFVFGSLPRALFSKTFMVFQYQALASHPVLVMHFIHFCRQMFYIRSLFPEKGCEPRCGTGSCLELELPPSLRRETHLGGTWARTQARIQIKKESKPREDFKCGPKILPISCDVFHHHRVGVCIMFGSCAK